jgi:tRNA (cmo5U34)-methyltransferase
MGAAAHLGIDLREYDARIRTFIPGYEQLLEITSRTLAATVRGRAPVIVDLGIGTGSLAAACLAATPSARIVGVDEDEEMLAAARARLGGKVVPLQGSFETIDLPRCDAVVASLALHHIPTIEGRRRLFRRVHRALRPRGVLIVADCYLATDAGMQAADRAYWITHLRRTYSSRQSEGYLRAWAREDSYARLADEIRLLDRVGFSTEVAGRRASFAVIAAMKDAKLK